MVKRQFSLSTWLVQSKDQAELNNLRTALLLLEDDRDRRNMLKCMRTFFERPTLLNRDRENRMFYNYFLARPAPGSVTIDPAHWQVLAESSCRLRA